jgi:hypothetical protein
MRTFALISFLALALLSCKVKYSFTGADFSDLESVTVNFIANRAPNGPSNLGQLFTDNLKDKFARETNLKQTELGGDIEFSGYISQYRISGQAPTAGQTDAIVRLTMTVQIDFENFVNPDKSWSKSFSQSIDYTSEQDLSLIEEELIRQLNAILADDIYTAALVDW